MSKRKKKKTKARENPWVLTCDICGEPIPPPGTGAVLGGDGLFYCKVCRYSCRPSSLRPGVDLF